LQENEPLIPKHGGYRDLMSFRIAQLIYDVTMCFCDAFIDKRSRTHDQMVQAARSGVQNIAEGSQASGTSKKMELKLTNVARASLEELRLDYQDFLRQGQSPLWSPDHPALMRFKSKRCATLDEFKAWAMEESASGPIRDRPSPSVLEANAALSLINLGCRLLDRQIAAQARAFEREGGFTERLYRTRQNRRRESV